MHYRIDILFAPGGVMLARFDRLAAEFRGYFVAAAAMGSNIYRLEKVSNLSLICVKLAQRFEATIAPFPSRLISLSIFR